MFKSAGSASICFNSMAAGDDPFAHEKTAGGLLGRQRPQEQGRRVSQTRRSLFIRIAASDSFKQQPSFS
jgi:hypothetical protein